uniref:Uncharacterized protein n=1 Tax=Romanomermis culicivorax TaxID=13658 RepID=A0A915ISW7_ROMCU
LPTLDRNLENTAVDGDGYVPKNSAEYCRILQQGANGHRVHVKPIKEFHHLVQRTYRSDPGVDELMKYLRSVISVDCGEEYRFLYCYRYIARLVSQDLLLTINISENNVIYIMEKINIFRSFHFTLFISWFWVREEQFIMECKVVVGTVSMLEAEEVLFIVSRNFRRFGFSKK